MTTAQTIYTAPRADAGLWTPETFTWDQVVAKAKNPAGRKECGGFIGGTLTLGHTPACDRRGNKDCQACGYVRDREHVESRWLVTLDVDYADEGFPDRVAGLGYSAILHPTWRHTPAAPRYRVLLPLDRAVPSVEYGDIVAGLMDRLGGAHLFDRRSAYPEQFMWWPATQDRAAYMAGLRVLDGSLAPSKALRVDGATLADLPPGEVRTGRYVYDGPDRDPALGVHPYAAKAIQQELARLDSLKYPWEPNAQWDNTTFAVACNLLEFANSGWAGYSHEQALDDLLEHAPADGTWGVREHRAKWESAERKVGYGGRPAPPETSSPSPSEDFGPVVADSAGDTLQTPGDGPRDRIRELFPPLDLDALLGPNRQERDWVVDGLVPAGASVSLIAPAGTGKSLLLLSLCLAVARGQDAWATLPVPRQRRVLYIDMENTDDDVAERMADMGVESSAGLGHLTYVPMPNMDTLDTAAGGEQLLQACACYGLQKGDLVVLDSAQRVVAGAENDADTWRAFYRHTAMRLKAQGITVIRTDNTGKDTSKSARGSSSKRDDVDIELLMTRDKTSGDLTLAPQKVRVRGIEQVTVKQSSADGRLQFEAGGRTTRHVETALSILEQAVPDATTGVNKSWEAIKEFCSKADKRLPTQSDVRLAVAERKKRAAQAAADFDDLI
ncbi:AAA family ATPase [Arsenicicoccus cauae]|uniref:AAA family ATPase n=1 Tax=Arsenicicoccus cauae TaxID=2663847 RepID=UPI00370D8EC4